VIRPVADQCCLAGLLFLKYMLRVFTRAIRVGPPQDHLPAFSAQFTARQFSPSLPRRGKPAVHRNTIKPPPLWATLHSPCAHAPHAKRISPRPSSPRRPRAHARHTAAGMAAFIPRPGQYTTSMNDHAPHIPARRCTTRCGAPSVRGADGGLARRGRAPAGVCGCVCDAEPALCGEVDLAAGRL
jgi:hypothetical protein